MKNYFDMAYKGKFNGSHVFEIALNIFDYTVYYNAEGYEYGSKFWFSQKPNTNSEVNFIKKQINKYLNN